MSLAFAPSDITAIPEPAAEGEENAPNLETATDVEAPVNNIPSPVIDPPSSHARSFSMENSFTSVLSTPTVRRKKTQRRQAINSKGIKVVKSLFNKMPSEQSSKKKILQKALAEKSKEASPSVGYLLAKSQVPAVSLPQQRRAGTASYAVLMLLQTCGHASNAADMSMRTVWNLAPMMKKFLFVHPVRTE